MKARKPLPPDSPELPEGRFYRVVIGTYGPRLQIREKRRIGSALLAQTDVFPNDWETAEEAVFRSAVTTFVKAGLVDRDREINAYEGDHL
jgi:hypothetical protein